MKSKLTKLLMSTVMLFLSTNSNCSEINNKQYECIDQNGNVINCLYYSACDNKYYKIDENNEKHIYSPEHRDIVLALFSDNNGGFYACDKQGVEYKYSPSNFKSIQHDKFNLQVVRKNNNIIILCPYFYININAIRESSMRWNNSSTISSTEDNTNNTVSNITNI